MTKRFKNYFFYRDREQDEVPWLRLTDKQLLELPRPIVLVNGAFDILHAPHMRLIFSARSKAASLVCALDSDDKIKASKGPSRPVLSFPERAAALNYMPLDAIVEIDCEADMKELMRLLKPDLRVQGADYRDKKSRFKVQKMLVREGKPHTSDLIERVLSKHDKNSNS